MILGISLNWPGGGINVWQIDGLLWDETLILHLMFGGGGAVVKLFGETMNMSLPFP